MDTKDRFYYKRDRLNQLRGFCATVQNECSSRKAAEKLGLEPSSVALQVKTLEDQLGVKLFDVTKNNRRTLTEAGKAFYDESVIQLQGLDGLFKNFLSKFQQNQNNEIRIAGHYNFLSSVLPIYIKKLSERDNFENLKIKLLNVPKNEGLDMLKAGEIDIAIYPAKNNEEIAIEFSEIPLFKWRSVLVVNKDHQILKKEKINEKDFKNYPYLFLDKYMFYNPNESLDLKPSNITFKNGDWEITSGLIRENLGMAFILESYFDRYCANDDSFRKVYVDKFTVNFHFSLFFKKNFTLKKDIEFLINEMKKDSDYKNNKSIV